MICDAKHLTLVVPDKEWKCPKCEESVGWVVEDSHDFDCDLFVASDGLCCEECGHEESARTFVNRYKKKVNMVKCPTCKGTGFVKKDSSLRRLRRCTKEDEDA